MKVVAAERVGIGVQLQGKILAAARALNRL
jgi:hypothetical protein